MKFDSLREKIAAEQDIRLDQNVRDDKPNPEGIKMNIDFTNLATIAYDCKRFSISEFLINYEQSIVRQIPFLLKINRN